jgi:ABC-type branched-subunit amino acid transport system substrate-binding protein
MGIHGPGDPGTRPTTFMTSSSRGSSPAVTLLHSMRARSTPPRLRRHGALRPVGAPVPLSGRYAIQGAQVRTGLELWADYAGVPLLLEDDESDPARAARLHAELSAHGCRFVLGPYGSDSTRVVAKAAPGSLLWSHGAAADDVQRLPAVVSVGSPASRYLIALGRAVAALRPSASLALVTASGTFARFAREGIEQAAPALGLTIVARFSFADDLARVAASRADAILACGPLQAELALLRPLASLRPCVLLGGVSPALAAFPALLGRDPEGILAPVQCHPRLSGAAALGPSSDEVVAAAWRSGRGAIDSVAGQAYAVALIAWHCLELDPENPLAAAQRLETSTFFGAFALDPESGIQRGHRLAVVRWRHGEQELILADTEDPATAFHRGQG